MPHARDELAATGAMPTTVLRLRRLRSTLVDSGGATAAKLRMQAAGLWMAVGLWMAAELRLRVTRASMAAAGGGLAFLCGLASADMPKCCLSLMGLRYSLTATPPPQWLEACLGAQG